MTKEIRIYAYTGRSDKGCIEGRQQIPFITIALELHCIIGINTNVRI